MAPPDKGLRGGPGSMLVVEMLAIGRASRSPGLEHQVMTVIPLSQPHLYSSATVFWFIFFILLLIILLQRFRDEHEQARCEHIYTKCSSVNCDVRAIYKGKEDA